MLRQTSKRPPRCLTERVLASPTPVSTGLGAAVSGFMAAGMIASACRSAGERCENSKGRSELSRLRDRARSLRSHLMGLAEQGGGKADAYDSPDDIGENQEYWLRMTLADDPTVQRLRSWLREQPE
ncbi:MAG: hypothetical protein ACE5HU_08180, partial [Acidobacteriota bacterium]